MAKRRPQLAIVLNEHLHKAEVHLEDEELDTLGYDVQQHLVVVRKLQDLLRLGLVFHVNACLERPT